MSWDHHLDEEWSDVPGAAGRMWVSTHGRVYRFNTQTRRAGPATTRDRGMGPCSYACQVPPPTSRAAPRACTSWSLRPSGGPARRGSRRATTTTTRRTTTWGTSTGARRSRTVGIGGGTPASPASAAVGLRRSVTPSSSPAGGPAQWSTSIWVTRSHIRPLVARGTGSASRSTWTKCGPWRPPRSFRHGGSHSCTSGRSMPRTAARVSVSAWRSTGSGPPSRAWPRTRSTRSTQRS